MALSRLAEAFAAEIRNHDWSDAPWRADRAGHDRSTDSNTGEQQLLPHETEIVRLNATWVTAQVLAYMDPNFDVYEFAEAAGKLLEERIDSRHLKDETSVGTVCRAFVTH